ncbi:DUF3124 domain-containing protein [uncultured Acetobacteroides sp.]|uniref:DUF3124 domain-containing protein n=1 Tax=uncultured Acetobacteroides sp. TaxID=1760811 RepID=UPI0029F5834E|nr:DUF3124 domain-containing protein [uncultured Acetobacteroides sp.]
MKKIWILLIPLLALSLACSRQKENSQKVNFPSSKYTESSISFSSLPIKKRAYVPIYSHIYHISGAKKLLLTATLSIRNTSSTDSIYIQNVSYFDSEGAPLKTYIAKTIAIKPMSAIELVVEDKEDKGGAGASFTVSYGYNNPKTKPLIQAVMIGTAGQQGISFVTQSVEVE